MRRARLGRARREHLAPVQLEAIAGKPPPHDEHLEGAVIGTCIQQEGALMEALEVLQPEHFWVERFALPFRGMMELVASGAKPDAASVASWLRDRGVWDRLGGFKFLADMTDGYAHVHDMQRAAKQIFDLWRMRKVVEVCTRANAEAYTSDVGDKGAWIEGVESAIYEVAHPGEKSEVEHVGLVLRSTFERIMAAAESGARMRGIPTGYDQLDCILAGLHDRTLMIIAARPGMGKTAFVMNMAANVASPRRASIPDSASVNGQREVDAPGYGVAVFSLEMGREELSERMVCSEGRVDMERLRTGRLQPQDWQNLTEASRCLSSLPIWIDDTPAISLLELRSKVRRIQTQWNRPATSDQPARRVGLVVIDYLQLMSGSGLADSREQEVGEISRGLKQLAKDFAVPVVALSQLNRSVETRSAKDKRPQLSDLRESGSLEQDADVVLFVHREEYFQKDETPDRLKGIAELIVAKQRSGRLGKAIVRFDGRYTRFDNLAPGECPDLGDE